MAASSRTASSSGWVASLVVATVVAVAPGKALAFQVWGAPSPTFGGSGAPFTLTALTFTVYRSGQSSPPGTSIPILLRYQTTGGAPIGDVPATLPPSGVLTISPPAGATSMNDRLLIIGDDPGVPGVAWYDGAWSWQGHIVLQCADAAANCAMNGTTNHWTIQGNPTIRASDSVAGPRTLTVVSSSFDLSWRGVDSLGAYITGSTSAIRLSDGTTIGFIDGEHLMGSGIPDFAHFFSPVLGFEGEMQTSASLTTIPSTTEMAFTAPSTSALPASPSVPALGTHGLWLMAACLLGAGLAMVGVERRRRVVEIEKNPPAGRP